MKINEVFNIKVKSIVEDINRTGKSKIAVVGWGRGMGHKGHMYLADAVITHASLLQADPYFVLSRSSIIDPNTGQVDKKHKDDPLTPEEKLQIYRKVFPQHSDIFQVATAQMPDLVSVLSNLYNKGYKQVVVIVGIDQVNQMKFVEKYNGSPDKKGNVPYKFDSLSVINRQQTTSQYADEEGPRATPMREILMDPSLDEEEKFKFWRASMPDQLNDQEVKNIMKKAASRLGAVLTGKKIVEPDPEESKSKTPSKQSKK